jgi:hypothetical protein
MRCLRKIRKKLPKLSLISKMKKSWLRKKLLWRRQLPPMKKIKKRRTKLIGKDLVRKWNQPLKRPRKIVARKKRSMKLRLRKLERKTQKLKPKKLKMQIKSLKKK